MNNMDNMAILKNEKDEDMHYKRAYCHLLENVKETVRLFNKFVRQAEDMRYIDSIEDSMKKDAAEALIKLQEDMYY